MLKKISIGVLALALSSCTSISNIGTIGPKKLKVYSIRDGDFLSENHMVIVLNSTGNVVAYSGGTVSGLGTVGLETAGTVATAGAIVVGANAVKSGLENTKVHGIPKTLNIKTDNAINVTGSIAKAN